MIPIGVVLLRKRCRFFSASVVPYVITYFSVLAAPGCTYSVRLSKLSYFIDDFVSLRFATDKRFFLSSYANVSPYCSRCTNMLLNIAVCAFRG